MDTSLSSSPLPSYTAVCGETSEYTIINDTINYHGYILDVNIVKLHVKAMDENFILMETISKFNPIEFKLSDIHHRVSANDELYIKQKIKDGAPHAPYYFSFNLKEKTETIIDDFTSNGYATWMLFAPAYLDLHTARGNLSNCKIETICDTFIKKCIEVRASWFERQVMMTMPTNVLNGYSWVSDMNVIKGCLHITICTMATRRGGPSSLLSMIDNLDSQGNEMKDLGERVVICVTLYTCADTDIKNLCCQIRGFFNDKNAVTEEELRTLRFSIKHIKRANDVIKYYRVSHSAKDFHVHIVILNESSGRPHC